MLLNCPEYKKNMEKCSQCNRHASLPFYVMLGRQAHRALFRLCMQQCQARNAKTNAAVRLPSPFNSPAAHADFLNQIALWHGHCHRILKDCGIPVDAGPGLTMTVLPCARFPGLMDVPADHRHELRRHMCDRRAPHMDAAGNLVLVAFGRRVRDKHRRAL